MYTWVLLNIALFVALVPGVLLTVPPNSSKMVVVLVHGLVFALLHHVLKRTVMRECFDNPDTRVNPPCPPNAVANKNGDCRIASDRYGLQ